ncbi:fumarylacetoacetase [Micromonospora sp. ATCC 39149]|nr:fumarylacetoacetase [Micromonospora sp. ATCC 39149]
MTWVTGAEGSVYGVRNLPYGVFRSGGGHPRVGVRIGEFVLDLAAAEAAGLVLAAGALGRPTLNAFLALGRPQWTAVRQRVTELLTDDAHRPAVEPLLVPLAAVELLAAVRGGGLRRLLLLRAPRGQRRADLPPRPAAAAAELEAPADRLPRPGRHGGRLRHADRPPHRAAGHPGRAGLRSVRTPRHRGRGGLRRRRVQRARRAGRGGRLRRPRLRGGAGQRLVRPGHPGLGVPAARPVPRQVLRHLRVGLGDAAGRARRRVRARARAGPAVDAVAARRAERGAGPAAGRGVERRAGHVEPPFATMYWTPAQQLAHLTINGASLRTGDLYASGTVSGPRRDQVGSFLELTWGGAEPVAVGGTTRTFLADGDTVTVTATAPGPDGTTVALGEVTGTILPAR